jgi:hypothetical protein
MEEIINFDDWLSNYVPEPVKYVAVYDPFTGFVTSIGPSTSFPDDVHKLFIDEETASAVISGEISINKCVVNVSAGVLEIVEVKNAFTLDDVLHRITSTRYAKFEPDILLTYNSKNKNLKIQMSDKYGGTLKNSTVKAQLRPIRESETTMTFLITEYNDPNLLYQVNSVKLSDLVGKNKIIKNINYENFSVFTRRLFKNYVIEYK